MMLFLLFCVFLRVYFEGGRHWCLGDGILNTTESWGFGFHFIFCALGAMTSLTRETRCPRDWLPRKNLARFNGILSGFACFGTVTFRQAYGKCWAFFSICPFVGLWKYLNTKLQPIKQFSNQKLLFWQFWDGPVPNFKLHNSTKGAFWQFRKPKRTQSHSPALLPVCSQTDRTSSSSRLRNYHEQQRWAGWFLGTGFLTLVWYGVCRWYRVCAGKS